MYRLERRHDKIYSPNVIGYSLVRTLDDFVKDIKSWILVGRHFYTKNNATNINHIVPGVGLYH